MHHNDSTHLKTGEKIKPEIVTFYNETKGGVDVVDNNSASHTCARNTTRWSMSTFQNILNITGINS